jgi:hypothetical protein
MNVLSYRYPKIQPTVSGSQEMLKVQTPSNASTATSFVSTGSSTINFLFASNTEFLRTNQSYFSFTLVAKDSQGQPVTSGVTTSKQGCSRAFSRLIVRIGSSILEDLPIDDLTAIHYSTLNPQVAKLLKFTEGFGDPDAMANGRRDFAMPIMSSIFSTEQAIPLPALTGNTGLSVEFTLAPASNLFTSTNISSFSVENPRIMWTSITPQANYTMGLIGALRQNRSIFLPYTRVRTYRSNGNQSTTQRLVLTPDNVTSVDGLTTVAWDETTYADRTKDKYERFIAPGGGVVSYTIEGGGVVQPSNVVYSGGKTPENLLNQFMNISGSVYDLGNAVNIPDNFYDASYRISQTWTSEIETHGSGLSLIGAASPLITVTTQHLTSVPSTVTFMTAVNTSALCEITSSFINITESF